MNSLTNPINLTETSPVVINHKIDQIPLTNHLVKEKNLVVLPSHPRISYLEEKISELEGGSNSLVLESLAVARYLLFKSILRQGDNIVSFNSWSLYFNEDPKYKNSGISIRLSVDGKVETLAELIDDRTKIIYLETVSNESLNISDLKEIAAIAKKKNIPFVVDNTSGGIGYHTSPLRYGANIVLLDTSPWLLQNKEYSGAVIIEDENYHWLNKNFDHLTNDETSKRRRKDTKAKTLYYFSILDHIRQSSFVKNIELPLAPNWYYDIENIDYILFKKAENTALLADWLKKQVQVISVDYKGLIENNDDKITQKLFRVGAGTTFSFQLNSDIIDNEFFFRKIRQIDIPVYLLKITQDIESSSIVVSIGYGDFEEIKRYFSKVFEIEKYPAKTNYRNIA